MKKIKLGLVFGGRSGEHEVSLVSARSIFDALDKKKYEINLIGIGEDGSWHWGKDEKIWLGKKGVGKLKLNKKLPIVTVVREREKIFLLDIKSRKKLTGIDVFFPITHGTFGEDGCLQGFFETIGAPYVGPGVLGSAMGMDKDVMKRIFREAGIPIADFVVLRRNNFSNKDIISATRKLNFPIFVKPANLGSSVGISKAKNKKELVIAIETALRFDHKIILEKAISGREIECSVLGNLYLDKKPIASWPGEIKLQSDFYSYEAKYINDQASTPIPKSDLDKKTAQKIQELAIKIFQILECEGMGRVDFFLTEKGEIFANEINTLPGFTAVSMYPKMFEQSGIPYPELLNELITLSIKRSERNSLLQRSFRDK